MNFIGKLKNITLYSVTSENDNNARMKDNFQEMIAREMFANKTTFCHCLHYTGSKWNISMKD